MAEVSESVTQENVTTNSTTMAHSSGVIVPTATTLNIWSAPYAVKARAPPKTKSRSQNRGAREARRDQPAAIATREPFEGLHRHSERREAGHRGAERRAHVARPGIFGRERQAVHR